MVSPNDLVEYTCTREICHVVYYASEDLTPLLRGAACPECELGVLDFREADTRDRARARDRAKAPVDGANAAASGS